jgi:hypothetical protein
MERKVIRSGNILVRNGLGYYKLPSNLTDFYFYLDPVNYNPSTLVWTDIVRGFNFTAAGGTGIITGNYDLPLVQLGGSKYLTRTSTGVPLTEFTVVTVARYQQGTTGVNGRIFSMQVGSGLDYTTPRSLPLCLDINNTGMISSLSTDNAAIECADAGPLVSGNYQVVISRWTSNTITNYVNAVPGAVYNATTPLNRSIDRWCIGGVCGSPTASTGLWQQPVADIIFYTRALNTMDITILTNFLRNKYNI